MARKTKRPTPKRKAKTKTKARVEPIAKGFHTVTPYLAQSDCAAALAFYVRAFGAKHLMQLTDPSGIVVHSEIRIGDSIIMMAQEAPRAKALSPKTIGGSPVRLHLSVKNVDAFVARAVEAGAELNRPVEDQFYGARTGVVDDPFGYSWLVSTQIENVSAKKMQKRLDAMMSGSGG